MIKYVDYILVFKIFHGQAPTPLQEFIRKNQNRTTRASSRLDCIVVEELEGASGDQLEDCGKLNCVAETNSEAPSQRQLHQIKTQSSTHPRSPLQHL